MSDDNTEDVIKRLCNENRQYINIINEIRYIINDEKEYENLSVIGSVKKVMSDLIKLKMENLSLKEKIRNLEK